jgi:hypothetical protein
VKKTAQSGLAEASRVITIQTRTYVPGLSGKEIFNFLLNPTDRDYQRWWTGTHFKLHLVKQVDGGVGSVVYMDELIGALRVKMTGVVIEAMRGRKITWQLKKVLRLPVWLSLELNDDSDGVSITHTIRAGYNGPGKALDRILRLYFSDAFTRALDEHVRTEFPKLRDTLRA